MRLLRERATRAGVSPGIQARHELLRRLGLQPRWREDTGGLVWRRGGPPRHWWGSVGRWTRSVKAKPTVGYAEPWPRCAVLVSSWGPRTHEWPRERYRTT